MVDTLSRAGRKIIKVEMNRVEGDLEIQLELDGNVVTDAWCIGKMYRGFEQILIGRKPTDSLVITPRICGICSTAQLFAATSALETAYQAIVAPNGARIRRLCLLAESVMSDARHTFLMFAPDLCNQVYRNHRLFSRVEKMFAAPFRGTVARDVVQRSKQLLAVIIAFGGQWPHSTYMLPGGVTCPLDREKLVQCLSSIESYLGWYERVVLGCSTERWLQVQSRKDFSNWYAEKREHQAAALGVLTRFARSIGLHKTGKGASHLLSAGGNGAPGFYNGTTGEVEPFDHMHIEEHVRYSWFQDPGGGRHPWDSDTVPDHSTGDDRYTFAKAPRYKGEVVQLGPLSDEVIAGDPLITSFFHRDGPSTWLRQFVRLHRPVRALQHMRQTVKDLLDDLHEPTWIPTEPCEDAEGYSFVNASRGALGHWIKIRAGNIHRYQIITPTTWNGSPRDSTGRRGHWEESFIGLEIKDLDNPIELLHVVRSHDACLVCTVHFVEAKKKHTFVPFS